MVKLEESTLVQVEKLNSKHVLLKNLKKIEYQF